MSGDSIRNSIESNWQEYLSRYGNLFKSDFISGTSPPSVFVGSYGYPKVGVGPMVPPIHGDTGLFDSPENWVGKNLEEIINFRLNLIRGIQKLDVDTTQGRYIENLHDLSMSSNPTDSEMTFHKNTNPVTFIDGESAPFGPVGELHSVKFSSSSSHKHIERAYYDRDLLAESAVISLYQNGIDVSRIQKCFSIGMFGKQRKLVPTKWSITATDDIISKNLVSEILEFDLIDSHRVFSFDHLGNMFSVILFPHRWVFEMQEAWHAENILEFAADHEDSSGIRHPPKIAGAYFAAKLGVSEYLKKIQSQSGVLVLREIQPEYAIPVGVWQIREGIRHAMQQKPYFASNLDDAISFASKRMSVSKTDWLLHGNMMKILQQKTITDFL